jgi:hypothetical protein
LAIENLRGRFGFEVSRFVIRGLSMLRNINRVQVSLELHQARPETVDPEALGMARFLGFFLHQVLTLVRASELRNPIVRPPATAQVRAAIALYARLH